MTAILWLALLQTLHTIVWPDQPVWTTDKAWTFTMCPNLPQLDKLLCCTNCARFYMAPLYLPLQQPPTGTTMSCCNNAGAEPHTSKWPLAVPTHDQCLTTTNTAQSPWWGFDIHVLQALLLVLTTTTVQHMPHILSCTVTAPSLMMTTAVFTDIPWYKPVHFLYGKNHYVRPGIPSHWMAYYPRNYFWPTHTRPTTMWPWWP